MRRLLSLRAALLIIVAAIGAYVLLAPPVIGLANQTDFVRFMQPFGIAYPPDITGKDQHWCFADVTFALTRPEGLQHPYFSSQTLFIAAAMGLHHLISKSSWFDIRFLAFVHLVALLIFFGKTIETIQNAVPHGRTVGLVLATLIVTDVGYLAFFNTFYAEPAAILFTISFVAFLFDALRQPRASNICLLAASAALLVTSKPQHALLGLVIGLFLIVVPFFRRDWRPFLTYCIAASVLVTGAGVYTASTIHVSDRTATLYATVFTGVLMDSANPRSDLAELGIDPNAEIYRGSSPFVSNNAVAAGYFPGRCTYSRLLAFYLVHPVRLLQRTDRVIRAVMSNRLPALGNFQRGTGHRCQEQAKCFSIWDPIRARFNSTFLVSGFFIVTAGTALILAIRYGSAYSYGYLLLTAMAGISFYAAALGDGVDYRKHMLLFHLLFDCCCCCAAMFTAGRARQFLTGHGMQGGAVRDAAEGSRARVEGSVQATSKPKPGSSSGQRGAQKLRPVKK